MLVEAAAQQVMLPLTEIGVLLADVAVSVLWIACGGLLFGASMLFVCLIAFLLLQPTLTTELFVPIDVIVVFIMGCVCFIPTGLFIRGVISGNKKENDGKW